DYQAVFALVSLEEQRNDGVAPNAIVGTGRGAAAAGDRDVDTSLRAADRGTQEVAGSGLQAQLQHDGFHRLLSFHVDRSFSVKIAELRRRSARLIQHRAVKGTGKKTVCRRSRHRSREGLGPFTQETVSVYPVNRPLARGAELV